MLEQQPDWNDFVYPAVDDLLAVLANHDAIHSEALTADSGSLAAFREQLVSYSMTLLAAAQTGTGNVRCNDGSSTVDCAFVLRPNDTPYYRCLHSPPDCYDVNHRTIACP